MEDKSFNRYELKEFISLLQSRNSNLKWAEQLKKWFAEQITKIGRSYALMCVVAHNQEGNELIADWMNVTETGNLFATQFRQEIHRVLLKEGISSKAGKRFFSAYEAGFWAEKRLRYMRQQSFICRFRKRKWRRKLKAARYRSFSLQFLAEVACCYYVESGLGDEKQAIKFFF